MQSLKFLRDRQSMPLIFLFLIFLSTPALANGKVKIIDGDGLKINGISYRLWGIDAPELDQTCTRDEIDYPCGKMALAVLKSYLGNEIPVCKKIDKDRYGRVIATCTVKGLDIGSAMVNFGWALDYERYSKGAYRYEQDMALEAGRGLWAGKFVVPWEWRKRGI